MLNLTKSETGRSREELTDKTGGGNTDGGRAAGRTITGHSVVSTVRARGRFQRRTCRKFSRASSGD
eukprot:2352812-Pyramimonas_sp.AAC.1